MKFEEILLPFARACVLPIKNQHACLNWDKLPIISCTQSNIEWKLVKLV